MILKYNPEASTYSDSYKTGLEKLKNMIDEFLSDYPNYASAISHKRNTCELVIDTSKIDDIVSYVNTINKKINNEIRFQFSLHSEIVDIKNPDGSVATKIMKNDSYYGGEFKYYNILKVLNSNKTLPALDSLFQDYGVFYNHVETANRLDYDSVRHFRLSNILKTSLDASILTNNNKSVGVVGSISLSEHSDSVTIKDGVYQLKNDFYQNHSHSKTYSIKNLIDDIKDFIMSNFKTLSNIENATTIEITSNGSIHIDDLKVVTFELHDTDYYRSRYDVGLSIRINVLDIVDGLIEDGGRLLKPQKRRTPISKDELYSKIENWILRISDILLNDSEIINQFNILKEKNKWIHN